MSNSDHSASDAHRKRLYFRSLRRGFKEVDLVFGTFARDHLATLPEHELGLYEALLAAPDHDVWLWLQGKLAPPAEFDTPLLARLQALCRRPHPEWIS